jgi:hypothetical protein
MVGFKQAGEFAGYYAIWRNTDQKPFSRDDVAFLRAAGPHIAHGLKTAQLMQRGDAEGDGFVLLPGWNSGVVLVDSGGPSDRDERQGKADFPAVGRARWG